MAIQKRNLKQALSSFTEHYSPKIIGELNGQHVKLVKLLGEFVWHHHEHEDEMFLVLDGHLTMEIAGQSPLELEPGEFVIIPHGVEHRPSAQVETAILLFEPASTLNTGNVRNELTVEQLERIN